MTGFRGVSVWALVCLAVGLGCADTASDAKPDKELSAEAPQSNVETVLTDQPLSDEPGSTVIPLNKIWGYMMPETQSIQLLEQGFFGPTARKNSEQGSPLYHRIVMAIKRQTEENQPIGPGFAVAGTGHKALVAAKEIMEQDEIPSQTFLAGTEVSLFFFTRALGMGFQLKEVKKSNETVTIRYQFGSDGSKRVQLLASTYYFALIPLGKMAAGRVAVNMIELPAKKTDDKHIPPYFKQRAEKQICKSFAFSIKPQTPK